MEKIKIKKTVDLPQIFQSDTEKFLLNQQIIAFLLTYIIESQSRFVDRGRIEKESLGKIIGLFRCVANNFESRRFNIGKQKYTTKELINELEDYNSRRNKIVHRLIGFHFKSNKEITKFVKETNKKGGIIKAILEDLFKEELDKKLQEVNKTLQEVKNRAKYASWHN